MSEHDEHDEPTHGGQRRPSDQQPRPTHGQLTRGDRQGSRDQPQPPPDAHDQQQQGQMQNDPRHTDSGAGAADDLGFDLPAPAKLTKTRALGMVLVLGAVGAGAFFLGWLPRHRAKANLEADSKRIETAAPKVDVIVPAVKTSDHALVLPGSIEPVESTVIYPRVNGYIKTWFVDIGDKVTEGQVLAEIDTPEIDQDIAGARAQLAQSQAALVQARANRELSKVNLDRYKGLVGAGVASQQDLDQREGQAKVDEAAITVAEAAIAAQQANLKRYADQKGFAKPVAPFSGTVTSRSAERGALVSSGPANPLFKIAITDPVRIVIAVPQEVAPTVKTGGKAEVTVREFAGEKFTGTISRDAGALDADTRTMQTEIRIANADGRLLSGMYAYISLMLPSPHKVLELPSTVLYSDSKGTRVAVVDGEGRVHFVPIVIERDTGATIEVASGLEGTEQVVKLSDASLKEGTKIEPNVVEIAPPK